MERWLFDAMCRAMRDAWLPACGGSEVPFSTRNGYRLLYCYNPASGQHAYLDCNTDVILTFEESRLAMGW